MELSQFVKYSTVNFVRINSDLELKLNFDHITYKHSLNVAHYSVQLSKCTQYYIDESLMYYSGLFHDIGKMLMKSEILNKDGTLSEHEFTKIKGHASFGNDILSKHRFPDEILNAAHFHHERFDGTGYPLGLKGENIPLIARIISICDVFDALTSHRPYRKAYTLDYAFKKMSDSFEQFDPELLRAFFRRFGNYELTLQG